MTKERTGEEAGRFNRIESRHQPLRGLALAHHEIFTCIVQVLQGTAGVRLGPSGHGGRPREEFQH